MKKQELKPDLGIYFLDKYGQNIEQHFYSVKIFHIIHVAHNTYSFTSNATFDNHEFAGSFDFTTLQLHELIDQINDDQFCTSLKNKLDKEFVFPEQVDFYEHPLIADIDAKLGNPVNSLYEKFVPFLISKFRSPTQIKYK